MSPSESPPAASRQWVVVTAMVPSIVAGVVLTVVLVVLVGLVGVLIGVGVTAAFAVYVAANVAVDPSPRVLDLLAARAATPERDARLVNLVEGLAVSGGVRTPELHVVESDGANLCVVGIEADAMHVVVTTALLEGLDRIQLEGVVGRAIVQIRHGEVPALTTALVVLAGRHRPTRVLTRPVTGAIRARFAPQVSADAEVLLDRDAVALTRYPPGLIAALERLEQGSTVVDAPLSGLGPLWFADPVGDADRAPLADRAMALELL